MNQHVIEKFKPYIADKGGPVISMFVPIERGEPNSPQTNQIRLKNALTSVNRAVEDDPNFTAQDRNRIYDGIEKLIDENYDWDRRGHSFASAITPDDITTGYLSRQVAPRVVVDDRLFALPLLRLTASEQVVAILDMDRDRALLHMVNGSVIESRLLSDAGVQGMGADDDDHSDQLQGHTAGRDGGSTQFVVHGQGQATHIERERLERWTNEIAQKLEQEMRNSDIPLLFAGDETLFGLYRKKNRYANFFDDHAAAAVTPDGIPASTLKDAKSISKQQVHRQIEYLNSAVRTATSAGRGSDQIRVIESAAVEGRIDTLLIADVLEDTSNDTNGNGKALQVVNRAACETIDKGGTVAVIAAADMPEGKPYQAAFRY